MEIPQHFIDLVGSPESSSLEYKATLIPSRSIAQILAGFANSEGGSLIFGVRERPKKPLDIEGISDDFNVQGIVLKAIGLLQPTTKVVYSYFSHSGKQLFGIHVAKSDERVLVEGTYFKREGDLIVNQDEKAPAIIPLKFPEFDTFKAMLYMEKVDATGAKSRFVDHYLNILRLYEPTIDQLFPVAITDKTTIPEGKLLNRILFTSCIDNFEAYLSELLYEIYLAKPETLKAGDSMVRVAEVLDCADIEEFIQKFAAKRVTKLQKGSIKGFIKETPEISGLDALNGDQITEIEKILQIRHLYTHRNGIVDEQFLLHFRGLYELNSEHQLSILEVLDILEYLVNIVKTIDAKAAEKYSLSSQTL